MSSDGSKHRSEWFGTACCPPNLMRTVESLADIFIPNRGIFSHRTYTLAMKPHYKWTAKQSACIQIPICPGKGRYPLRWMDQPTEFTFRLRVPSWATDENTLSVNGETVSAEPDEQGYVVLDRTWNEGDSIDLNFTMETKRVYSDPRVEANQGRVAVKRGPIVYAAEDVDNEYPVTQYYLPKDATFTTKWIENLEDENSTAPLHTRPMLRQI